MKRQCLQKFASVFFGFCISLSFFISSFADAFTGAYLYTGVDPVTGQPIVEVRGVNPSYQTFSGSNVIEMNAYNNAPILTSNTFNGTTSIDPAFTNITSNGNTYNGTTTITYDGITGGQLESNNDTFASANVNTSNADVELNNPTFNGNTTLQAQNVSLGSISQMDSLIDMLYPLVYQMTVYYMRSQSTNPNSYTNVTSPSGNSVRINYIYYVNSAVIYDSTNHTLSLDQDATYCTFISYISYVFRNINNSLIALGNYLGYQFNNLISFLMGQGNYNLYSISFSGETYSFSYTTQNTTFRVALLNRLDALVQLINWYCGRFFEWYYPLDSSAPYYWRYYNTDTELQESIGLAGLWYNISWYLGEIYQNLTDAGSDMTQDAQQLGSSISALNTAEESVNTQIQSAFSTVNNLMTLPVISAAALCISWIEYMWGSLGIFQSPTLLAYMCVILMMLIGFAKYRSAFR